MNWYEWYNKTFDIFEEVYTGGQIPEIGMDMLRDTGVSEDLIATWELLHLYKRHPLRGKTCLGYIWYWTPNDRGLESPHHWHLPCYANLFAEPFDENREKVKKFGHQTFVYLKDFPWKPCVFARPDWVPSANWPDSKEVISVDHHKAFSSVASAMMRAVWCICHPNDVYWGD